MRRCGIKSHIKSFGVIAQRFGAKPEGRKKKQQVAAPAVFQMLCHYVGRKLSVIENTTEQFELRNKTPARETNVAAAAIYIFSPLNIDKGVGEKSRGAFISERGKLL